MSSTQLLPHLPADVWGANRAKTKGGESGVSMQMDVKNESVQKDETGKLDTLKNKILKNRPQEGSLSWPAPKEEDDK